MKGISKWKIKLNEQKVQRKILQKQKKGEGKPGVRNHKAPNSIYGNTHANQTVQNGKINKA